MELTVAATATPEFIAWHGPGFEPGDYETAEVTERPDVEDQVTKVLESVWDTQKGISRAWMEFQGADGNIVRGQYRVFGWVNPFDPRETDEAAAWHDTLTALYENIRNYAEKHSVTPDTHYMVLRRPAEARMLTWPSSGKCEARVSTRFVFMRKDDWDNQISMPAGHYE